jgi:hypothetical protein
MIPYTMRTFTSQTVFSALMPSSNSCDGSFPSWNNQTHNPIRSTLQDEAGACAHISGVSGSQHLLNRSSNESSSRG